MSIFFKRPSAKVITLFACLGIATLLVAGCSSRAERAQNYYEHGMSYLKANDFVKARIELRNALQLKADMLPAWQALAQIEEHDKNWQGLAGSLRRVAELDPKDIEARIRLARLMLLGGATDEALKIANAAAEIDPKNATVLVVKAAIFLRLKDTEAATREAQKALELDAANPDASAVLAAAKFMGGDSDGALKTLGQVTGAHQDDLGIITLKINIFDRMGNLPQVESLLQKLITLYPKEPAFRTQLVRFYLAHKRQDDAVNELRSVVAANPADINAELQLVNLLGTINGPPAARAELLARINAGGQVFPYQLALAKFDFAQGKAADSIKLLQELITNSKSPDDTLTARSTLAEMYLNRNDVAAAETQVTEILRADARNTNGLRLRAAIHLNRSQIDDAIADLRSALNDQPRSPELLASLATAYERNGSIELADKAFFDATKASGFAPAIGLNYIAFLRRRAMTAQAETVLTELANRNQNNLAVLSTLAREKLARQDWVGAHAIADTIKRLGDKSDVADQINAAAFSGQGKFSDSLAAIQNTYNANPGAVRPMAELVAVYLKSGQTAQAESFVRSVLADNPANAEALVLLGSIQTTKNAPDQAEKSFKTAIEKKPKDVAGYQALADLYVRQKKYDDALKVIKDGLEQQPQNFALHLALAGLFEIKGQYEPAIAEYEAMLKDQPGSLIVANNLASLLADHRTDKASLERASSVAVLLKNSEVPQFKDTLGWVNYQREDYRAAIPLLESAAASLPNVALVHYHLGMSYLATAQDAKASEQFKKARELAPNDTELNLKIDAALKNRSEKAKG